MASRSHLPQLWSTTPRAKLRSPFFPKQFTVGVLNSILKCVRLVSGAVSASGRFVFQFICLPIHLSPRSCVRGCVRLRTICLPIHLSPNSFVSQFICLPGPVSGAVSASGGFVSQFICPPCVRGCVRLRTICLPIHLSPRSCGRGCVRLRGIGFPIHLSPKSFVSQVLCQGLCPPSGDWSPNSFVSQFICLPGPCLPIHLSPRSCGRGCVRLRGIGFPIHLSPNSFVSQVLVSQFICLPGPVAGAVSASGGLVSQFICLPIHLSPRSCVRGCVRLRGICLPIRLSSIIPQTVYCWRSQFSFKRCPAMFRWWCLALRMSRIHLSPCGNSFVSQSGWWCPALWLSPIHLFALISTHLFPSLAGGVRLFGCLQFICLPLWQLICLPIWLVVSGFGCLQFICLALWQLICLPVWLVVSGSSAVSVTLVMSGSLAVSNSFVSKSGWWRLCLPNDSFVSQSGWWCPAFRLAPIHLSPLVTLHLSPSLAGGVRLSGCLQFICFRLVAIHLSPSLAGGVRLSMLSAVSNSFVFPCGKWFVSQSGWWCPALWLSPSHLFPLVATHLFPSLAGGVRPFGCLQFICLPIYRFVCLPVWLVVSGFGCLQFMCLPLWQSICLPVWLVVFGSLRVSIPVWLVVSGLGYVQVICFPLVAIHLSPSLAGGVRLSACLDPTRLVVSGSSTVSNSFVSPCSNAFVSQSG